MTARAYIALGSNLGDRAAHLAFARDAIASLPGTRLVTASPVEETEAIGPPQGDYLNQMLAVDTTLAPSALLDALLAIERAAGRTRDPNVRWSARTLDCDIVLFGDLTIDTERLTVPHPGLRDRAFWWRELVALGVDPAAPVQGHLAERRP
jgi:2-amino-4-hydroxy-6-hydroxymethyldihydropteridine diphosphokinase